MKNSSLEKLAPFIPFMASAIKNQNSPSIPGEIIEVYADEFPPGLLKPGCGVCVQEMLTTLFYQYERDMKNRTLKTSLEFTKPTPEAIQKASEASSTVNVAVYPDGRSQVLTGGVREILTAPLSSITKANETTPKNKGGRPKGSGTKAK